MIDCVDIGCKKAGAMCVARNSGRIPVGNRNIGVDISGRHRQQVESKGFEFVQADVVTWSFPKARVYLAWNALEHLPSVEAAKAAAAKMFKSATDVVWLLLPSFEDADRARLAKMGCDFDWALWPHHTAHVQVRDIQDVVPSGWVLEHKTKWIKRRTTDKSIVGERLPDREIVPPVPGAHDLFYRRKP